LHHHETDASYDNVILHVVWEHNTIIFRKDNTEIPTLELKNYVNQETILKYELLVSRKTWIFCEDQIQQVPDFIVRNWKQRLFFERLERKSEFIDSVLQQTQNDWEATLFRLLAKNFGLNINGPVFFKIASAIPFSIIRKESAIVESLEALLFGVAGLLDEDKEDVYYTETRAKFNYLVSKYRIKIPVIEPVQFFRLRPDNFPTIRLSQLANLYRSQHSLFSRVIEADSVTDLYDLFQVAASPYWQSHYQFDHASKTSRKLLSRSFVDLIIINTIVPIQFAYAASQGKERIENLVSLLETIKAEVNGTIQKFQSIKVIAGNAFESQSLLQLKNDYCDRSRCLSCEIGIELLKDIQ
jgi:hypothetical protein